MEIKKAEDKLNEEVKQMEIVKFIDEKYGVIDLVSQRTVQRWLDNLNIECIQPRPKRNRDIRYRKADVLKLEKIKRQNLNRKKSLYEERSSKQKIAQQYQEKGDYNMKCKIITLCGSTRFKEQFIQTQKELTLNGNIVLSCVIFSHSGDVIDNQTKEMLDVMHLQKIDISDEIFVINVSGYIGESTRSEIKYAENKGIKVNYLEKPIKTEKEIRGELKTIESTIKNHKISYKNSEIPKDVFMTLMAENRAMLTTLSWVLGEAERWD